MTYTKILVTGATGFIGSRFCEKLALDYRIPYRSLVRNYNKAARIARLGAEMFGGDLGDTDSLDAALDGCDAVVHLGFGEVRRAERNLMAACRRARIKRFIHISSMAVHGPQPSPNCAREETAVIGRYGEDYSDSKARAELVVQRSISAGFPAVILRPTIVYGPYGPFVHQVVQAAQNGRITLIDGGRGICNAVYVDDVCDAIFAALYNDQALGKAFFVTADRAILWREFILTFANMVSPQLLIDDVSAAEVNVYLKAKKSSFRSNSRALKHLLGSPDFHDQLGTVPALRSAIRWSKATLKKVLPPDQVAALKNMRTNESGQSRFRDFPNFGRIVREDFHLEFSNERAKNVLGWKPMFDFQAGASVTRKWLEFAGIATPNNLPISRVWSFKSRA